MSHATRFRLSVAPQRWLMLFSGFILWDLAPEPTKDSRKA